MLRMRPALVRAYLSTLPEIAACGLSNALPCGGGRWNFPIREVFPEMETLSSIPAQVYDCSMSVGGRRKGSGGGDWGMTTTDSDWLGRRSQVKTQQSLSHLWPASTVAIITPLVMCDVGQESRGGRKRGRVRQSTYKAHVRCMISCHYICTWWLIV